MKTPRLSQHARERCEQMGIKTKRAKRVVMERNISYQGPHPNDGIVCQSDDPDIAVVWDPVHNVIITVLPNTQENYER